MRASSPRYLIVLLLVASLVLAGLVLGRTGSQLALAAPVSEFLWATAQSCPFGSIADPNGSTDGAFNDATASCNGTYVSGGAAWVFNAVEDTVAVQTVTSVTLDIRLSITGFDNKKPDTITLEVSSDNGASWDPTPLASFSSEVSPLQTLQYDISSVFTTKAQVDAAQVRLRGATQNGGMDTITITIDGIMFTVDGDDVSAATNTPTSTSTATSTPTATATSTSTPTNTPPGPTSTPTDTPPGPTSTPSPTATPTATSTPGGPTPTPGADPHGGYSATTDSCAACHRTHTSETPPLLNSTSAGNAFCLTCHNGTGAPANPVVSTHSNADESGVEQTFTLECSQCHEPHGSDNLSSIRDYVRVDIVAQPEVTAGPVVFTATTGTNSFDDGTSPVSSRICAVCHDNPDNPGHPMQSHTGGAGHNGGSNDYSGQNCISCHPHSTDADQSTNDGFMPSGCTGCHGVSLGARRQVTGSGGDFERASHHVSTTIQDSDCEVCHDARQHTGTPGNPVRLYNADDPGITYVLDGTDDAGNLELFCLSCHDADGAGGSTPFSDSTIPPPIDNAVWSSASHNSSGSASSCVDCHDNGHGSNKSRLLAPYNITADSDPDDPFQQEERFCYTCHSSAGPAVSDIEIQFGYSSHHRIAATEQEVATVKEVDLECSNCHNPHTVNGANKLSNPADLTQFSSNNNDFCLTCHDGTPPPGVAFGAFSSSGFGWDKLAYINNTTHFLGDDNLPNILCQDCHESHGSNANYDPGSGDPTQYADLLKGRYVRVVDQSFYTDGFALCWNCHEPTMITGSNAWAGEHNSHDDDGPCIWCHDVHSPAEPGEAGLVSFHYANTYGDLLLQYSSKGSDIFTDLETSYERAGTPQCGITCHSTSHQSKSFNPDPLPDPPGSTLP